MFRQARLKRTRRTESGVSMKRKRNILFFMVALAMVVGLSTVYAAELVSKASDGTPGNQIVDINRSPSISDDGRFVAFATFATNLGPVDTNGVRDVYVHDRVLGTNELVSIDSQGNQANLDCWQPIISGDGRFVAFASHADNLVPGHLFGSRDIFVHDRQLHTTEMVNLDNQGNQAASSTGGADVLDITPDGRYVVFWSDNPYVVEDTGQRDVYVRDRVLGITERISVNSQGTQQALGNADFHAAISADGRFVAFASTATNLGPNEPTTLHDVYVRDRATQTTERVSNNYLDPTFPGDSSSYVTDMSHDGRFVVMQSSATDLVPGDSNLSIFDIFVHDRSTGLTELVSVDSFGNAADGHSFNPAGVAASISGDGRFVTFQSAATNLVANDTNGRQDIFLRDRNAGTTVRLSLGPLGVQADGNSVLPRITPDGKVIAFHSLARNLVEGQTILHRQVYVANNGAANEPPVADAGGPYSVSEGGSVTVTGSGSSDPEGETLTFDWDLDNNGTFETPGQDVPLSALDTADGPAVRTVQLQVTDAEGATAVDSATVTIVNVAPMVGPITGLPVTPTPLTTAVTPTADFTDPGVLDTHTVVWDWGDGTTSAGTVSEANGSGVASGSHLYQAAGTYVVSCTVTDKDGASSTCPPFDSVEVFDPNANNAPLAEAGGPYSVMEGGAVTLQGSGSDPDNDPLTYAWDLDNNGTFETPGQNVSFSGVNTSDGPTSAIVQLQVRDDEGATAVDSATVNIVNVAPTVAAIAGLPLTPTPLTTAVTPTADFTDPGVLDTHTVVWDWGDGTTSAGTVSEANGSGVVSGSHLYQAVGTYVVSCTVTDKDGAASTCPPFDAVEVFDPNANHVPLADAGGPYTVLEGGAVSLQGSGSDPDNDPLTYAWDLDNDGTFEMPGQTVSFGGAQTSDGPASHIVQLQVTDAKGAMAVDAATVEILNVAPSVGAITDLPIDPTPLTTMFSPSADFTDPGIMDTHTVVWDWGDGTTSAGTVEEVDGSGTVFGSHVYQVPGIYPVSCTITDKDGASASCAPFEYLVVYDPKGGFVTGGGFIVSPEGAYVAEPSLTGNATFGFVAKYQKGKSTPIGQTQFQFHATNFNFHSSEYEWLVVAGARAQFKGTGSVNGVDGFGFMLTAIDGQLPGGGDVDKFRMKVWELSTDNLIYDNELGESDDADPTTEVTQGSIVIHKSKK